MSKMESKRRENNWQAGQSGNAAGRPVESPEQKEAKKKLSKLRATEKKLLNLNPKALRVISASLDGESLDGKEIDKEQVATAKWIVNTTITVSKAAMSEEIAILGVKDVSAQNELEERQAEDGIEDSTPRFSMTMLAEAETVSLQ